jgi:hypothetical protein
VARLTIGGVLTTPLQRVHHPVIPILFIVIVDQSQDHLIEFGAIEDAIF